jgi:hypothetical protein
MRRHKIKRILVIKCYYILNISVRILIQFLAGGEPRRDGAAAAPRQRSAS